jgi:hypothetical protein
MSEGNLTESMVGEYVGAYKPIKEAINATITRLKGMVLQIKQSAQSVSEASGEISTGSGDLSQRTEEQASSLEETAASMEQITGTVKQNAENAKNANSLASGARSIAERGGSVVSETVSAMQNIEKSSQKIADIFETLLTSNNRNIIIEVDGKRKAYKISSLVAPYRTSYGITNYCSPLLLPFIEQSLNIAKPLPKEGKWLSGANLCRSLKILPSPTNITQAQEYLRDLLIEKGQNEITLDNGSTLRISDVVGRYSSGGRSAYFIREDAVNKLVHRENIKTETKKMAPEGFIPPTVLNLRCNLKRKLDNLYATRKVLEELYEGSRTIEGLNPKTDLHKVEKDNPSNKTKNDIIYIREDKAYLVTWKMIQERKKELKLWELDLLGHISNARKTPEKLKLAA